MNPKPNSDLLYDSEAALRLVDRAMEDFRDESPSLRPHIGASIGASISARIGDAERGNPSAAVDCLAVSELLANGYSAILEVLNSLRQSRHLLERATVERISHTHDKLREVSRATEVAVTDILNGLDRANCVVDELETYAATSGEPDAQGQTLRGTLRDELFALMGHMQFQDIASQQLAYASAVLSDMESRLDHVVRLLDPTGVGNQPLGAAPERLEGDETFDASASVNGRVERQAIADAVIATTSAT